MEYAVDDWGIAAMAQKMGKTADYETFSKRAHYYKNYFDSSIHFIRPKLEDVHGVLRTIRHVLFTESAISVRATMAIYILRSARSVWIDQPVWR